MRDIRCAYVDIGLSTDEIPSCCDDNARAIIENAIYKAIASIEPRATIANLNIEIIHARKF
jgi:hypothetical protein